MFCLEREVEDFTFYLYVCSGYRTYFDCDVNNTVLTSTSGIIRHRIIIIVICVRYQRSVLSGAMKKKHIGIIFKTFLNISTQNHFYIILY